VGQSKKSGDAGHEIPREDSTGSQHSGRSDQGMVQIKVGDPELESSAPARTEDRKRQKKNTKEVYRVLKSMHDARTREEREVAWDDFSRFEMEELADFADQALKVQERASDIFARKIYAGCIFALIVVWLGLVIGTVWRSANERNFFQLSEPVLVALLSTTTVNVIGLMYVVARYLFPNRTSK